VRESGKSAAGLLKTKKISISPPTISRALRFSDPQWEGYSSIIEPHIRTIEDFFDEGYVPRNVYFERDEQEFQQKMGSCWDDCEKAPFPITILWHDCKASILFIGFTWFSLSQSTRSKCMLYLIEEDDVQEIQ